jgi:hypothetical protein
LAQKPFKDREQVKKEIRIWGLRTDMCICLGLLFAIIGIIADALNITLGLETMSWFLLAVFFGALSTGPHVHLAIARSLFDIESENNNNY